MPIDRYNGTTKEQRKMARAVAADVLLQIKKRSLTIRIGTYCSPLTDEAVRYRDRALDIQTAPRKILKQCSVCAKGAMFISRALLFNEYNFSDNANYCAQQDFGILNADLIESAFENCKMGEAGYCKMGEAGYEDARERGRTAVDFGLRYKNPRARLKAIMENVVANKGVFRPDKPAKPVAKAK